MPALRTRTTHPALRLSAAAQPPPSLKIIAPTPRTFTFPPSHTLSENPYASPSTSPFESDSQPLALSAPSATPSPFSSHHDSDEWQRRLSPASSGVPATPSPPPPASTRRKSAAARAPVVRRPKKGDDDYVKRPENAFILFRRQCCEDLSSPAASSPSPSTPSPSSPPAAAASPSAPKKLRQADLSKTISQQWKALSAEERAYWEGLAKEKKRQHEARHPDYVYRPQRRRNRMASDPPDIQNPPESEPAAEQQHVEVFVPVARSASAPLPPYHSFQIPDVYGGYGAMQYADPTSLAPLIAQCGMGMGMGGSFDYMPTFDFAASLQSSVDDDFLLRPMLPGLSPPQPGVLSPASSTSGSAPASPFTPAGTGAFHPSVFSASASASYPPALTLGSPGDDGLGLSGMGERASEGDVESYDYAPYASTWAANSSPWGTTTTPGAGLAQGDFELGHIPEIGHGWAAFPDPAATPEVGEFGAQQPYENSKKQEELGDGLHFGDEGGL
ncbi:hypothetical protein C8R46DRAFT_436538 [Mycena filopes]|nr:hypothetical protein C8R46DRAFT_436538 [Mycena filopes]